MCGRFGPQTGLGDRASAAITLSVEGMGCPHCATRVYNAIVSIDGVAAAHVSLVPPLASARYDPELVSADDLIAAVAGAGAGTRHQYRVAIPL